MHICTHTHLLCLLFCNIFFPMAMDQTFVFSFAKMVIVSICTGHVYNTDVCHHWLLHLEAPLLIVDFALKLLVLDILDHNLNRFSVLKNHSKSTFFFVFFCAEFVFHTLRTIQVCLGCNLEHSSQEQSLLNFLLFNVNVCMKSILAIGIFTCLYSFRVLKMILFLVHVYCIYLGFLSLGSPGQTLFDLVVVEVVLCSAFCIFVLHCSNYSQILDVDIWPQFCLRKETNNAEYTTR